MKYISNEFFFEFVGISSTFITVLGSGLRILSNRVVATKSKKRVDNLQPAKNKFKTKIATESLSCIHMNSEDSGGTKKKFEIYIWIVPCSQCLFPAPPDKAHVFGLKSVLLIKQKLFLSSFLSLYFSLFLFIFFTFYASLPFFCSLSLDNLFHFPIFHSK